MDIKQYICIIKYYIEMTKIEIVQGEKQGMERKIRMAIG